MSQRMMLNECIEQQLVDVTIVQDIDTFNIVLIGTTGSTIWKRNDIIKLYNADESIKGYAAVPEDFDSSDPSTHSVYVQMNAMRLHFGADLSHYGITVTDGWNEEYEAREFRLRYLPPQQYFVTVYNTYLGVNLTHTFTVT